MSDQQVRREELDAIRARDAATTITRNSYSVAQQTGPDGVLVLDGGRQSAVDRRALLAELSRTDAELRKERTARVEAERRADKLAVQTIDDAGVIGALERERDHLRHDNEHYVEIGATLATDNAKLLERIASLESDLSAVTASSVEHAKTIDGLRAELARARELAVRLLIVHEDRDEQTAKAIFDSARSATHSEGKEGA